MYHYSFYFIFWKTVLFSIFYFWYLFFGNIQKFTNHLLNDLFSTKHNYIKKSCELFITKPKIFKYNIYFCMLHVNSSLFYNQSFSCSIIISIIERLDKLKFLWQFGKFRYFLFSMHTVFLRYWKIDWCSQVLSFRSNSMVSTQRVQILLFSFGSGNIDVSTLFLKLSTWKITNVIITDQQWDIEFSCFFFYHTKKKIKHILFQFFWNPFYIGSFQKQNQLLRIIFSTRLLCKIYKFKFADEFLELSLFFKDFPASYSELLCIFPCFCPYGLFTRANFNDTAI